MVLGAVWKVGRKEVVGEMERDKLAMVYSWCHWLGRRGCLEWWADEQGICSGVHLLLTQTEVPQKNCQGFTVPLFIWSQEGMISLPLKEWHSLSVFFILFPAHIPHIQHSSYQGLSCRMVRKFHVNGASLDSANSSLKDCVHKGVWWTNN